MEAAEFYDTLAPYFHLIHPDWDASVERQGSQLEAVVRRFVPDARTVLDCACGIGTQALGLAARGFEVTATDVSGRAVARARAEANRRNLAMTFGVADFREPPGGTFDVVLAADNAIPHLLDDEQIRHAFRAMRGATRDGGVCLVSVRDYDAMEKEGLQIQTHAVHRIEGRLCSIFQVREFDGRIYDVYVHVVEGERVTIAHSRYYAVSIDRLRALMLEAGFAKSVRLDGAFVQPLVAGLTRG